MKTYLITSLCLIAATALSAREFTDLQGRKLEAELVSVAGGQAVLKRAADGRSFTVPVASFSAEDQKLMNEFAAANMNYKFEVKYTKKKLGETTQRSGPIVMEVERWAYKVDLRNVSSANVSDMRVDYWCFRKADEGQGQGSARVEASGSLKIENLAKNGLHQFETMPVEINKQKLEGNYIYIDGTRPRQSDSMGGIVLRVFQGDREVYKFATKDDLFVAAVGKPSANGSNAKKP